MVRYFGVALVENQKRRSGGNLTSSGSGNFDKQEIGNIKIINNNNNNNINNNINERDVDEIALALEPLSHTLAQHLERHGSFMRFVVFCYQNFQLIPI